MGEGVAIGGEGGKEDRERLNVLVGVGVRVRMLASEVADEGGRGGG